MPLIATAQTNKDASAARRNSRFANVVAHLRTLFGSNLIPLPFLGYGLLRGWLSVHCETSFAEGAGIGISQDVFDLALATVYLFCAAFARRLTPLCSKRWARFLCAAFLAATSLLWYVPFGGHGTPFAVACLQIAMSSAGCALLSLLWFELYATLSPVRMCLYYTSSILVGAGIGWLYQGFRPEWLPVAATLLPFASLRCLHNCYAREEAAPTGKLQWARFSFPWQPVLVIAAFAFSYGMLYFSSAAIERQVTSIGTVLCSLFILGLVVLVRGKIGFGAIYSMLLPFMGAISLTLAAAGVFGPWWSNLLANWGHITSMVLISIIMGTICYHWGTSAVWLFGIESCVWTVATVAGRLFENVLTSQGLPTVIPVAVVAFTAAAIILRQRRTSATWGIFLTAIQTDSEVPDPVQEQGSLTQACSLLASEHNLSQREEEVLFLLAQRKTARDIEQELCVANGTARAHINHVYQKLGIHTREELFARVEEARGRACAQAPRPGRRHWA